MEQTNEGILPQEFTEPEFNILGLKLPSMNMEALFPENIDFNI